jgi:hypothetical protein
MRLAGLAVMFTMAALLLAAGLEKARHLVSFAASLRELGLKRGAALTAAAVVVLEIAVALAIVFQPKSMFTAAGVLALATSFAIAGLLALRHPGTLSCNCFGPYGETTLGRNQLIAFPFWIADAALLWSQPSPPLATRVATFAAIGLTLAALRAPSAIRELSSFNARSGGTRAGHAERDLPSRAGAAAGGHRGDVAVVQPLRRLDPGNSGASGSGAFAEAWRAGDGGDGLRHRVRIAALIWGFDTGLLVTTFRVAAVSWGALLLTALGLARPWTGISYGLGFAIPFLFLVFRPRLGRASRSAAPFCSEATAYCSAG